MRSRRPAGSGWPRRLPTLGEDRCAPARLRRDGSPPSEPRGRSRRPPCEGPRRKRNPTGVASTAGTAGAGDRRAQPCYSSDRGLDPAIPQGYGRGPCIAPRLCCLAVDGQGSARGPQDPLPGEDGLIGPHRSFKVRKKGEFPGVPARTVRLSVPIRAGTPERVLSATGARDHRQCASAALPAPST